MVQNHIDAAPTANPRRPRSRQVCAAAGLPPSPAGPPPPSPSPAVLPPPPYLQDAASKTTHGRRSNGCCRSRSVTAGGERSSSWRRVARGEARRNELVEPAAAGSPAGDASGRLTDRAFEYIGKYGKSVRTLSVAFAGDSDLALQHLLQGCSKLEKLEIRDCPFGDAGLLSGMHHFYNMRFVWMSGCNLTLQGCKEVARRLPRMVVELVNSQPESERTDGVDILYMYRSLEGPREDVPPFGTPRPPPAALDLVAVRAAGLAPARSRVVPLQTAVGHGPIDWGSAAASLYFSLSPVNDQWNSATCLGFDCR